MYYKPSRFYDPYYTDESLEEYISYHKKVKQRIFTNRLEVGDFAIGANLIIIKCIGVDKYRLESPNGFCSNRIHKKEVEGLSNAQDIYSQMLENFAKCEPECRGDSAERDRLIGCDNNIYKKYLLFAYSRILLNEDSVIYKHSKVERQKDIELSRTWYYNPFYEFLPKTDIEKVIKNNPKVFPPKGANKMVDNSIYII